MMGMNSLSSNIVFYPNVGTNIRIAASKPWKSPDRVKEAGKKGRPLTGDPQAMIDFCLNHCPFPNGECRNCVESRMKEKKVEA